jgi:uncharacterized protein (TIGR02996 family)
MIPENAFLQAVIADPDDDAPRLIYADWLDEQGQSERAEFIRVQCELVRLPVGSARRKELRTRACELLAQHGKAWVERLRGAATHCTLRRGFVERLTLPVRVLACEVEWLRRWAPIRRVLVTVTADVIDYIPEAVARENQLLPLACDGECLSVGMNDVSDLDLIQKLQFVVNRDITPIPMRPEDLREAINHHYRDAQWAEAVDPALAAFVDSDIEFELLRGSYLPSRSDGESAVNRLVDLILREAVVMGANTIRIDSHADSFNVLYCVAHGWVWRDSLPVLLLAPLVTRIMFLAGIDRVEMAVRQHGSIVRPIEGRWYRIVVDILPTARGAIVLMRIAP